MTYYFHMSCYLAPEKNQLDMHIRNWMNLIYKNGYILLCWQHKDLKLEKDGNVLPSQCYAICRFIENIGVC